MKSSPNRSSTIGLATLCYTSPIGFISKGRMNKKTLRQEAALKTAARNGVFFCWSYFPLNKPSEIPKPGGGLRASRIIARSPCQGSTLLTTQQNLRFSPQDPGVLPDTTVLPPQNSMRDQGKNKNWLVVYLPL